MILQTIRNSSGGTAIIIMILVVIGFYFIPTIIAFIKKKPNKIAIAALNLFLGWCVIGWVVSLIWALSNDAVPQNIVITQPSQPNNFDKYSEIEKLNNLFEKGLISKEEFELKKEQLLNS